MTTKASSVKNPPKHVRWFESWTFLITVCIILPIMFRSFVYAPYHIPSGSMKSTLLVGDYIFVSKMAYGYSRYSFPLGFKWFDGRLGFTEPQRGDIVVFRPPSDTRTDYIKRLVGLPGDTIQVVDGRLLINGAAVTLSAMKSFMDDEAPNVSFEVIRYLETLPGGKTHEILDVTSEGSLDNTPEYTVPAGHYFLMGDNRDQSQDSRVMDKVGFVPAENLVGRADMIFLSTKSPLWQLWKWPNNFRKGRFLVSL